MKRSSFHKLLIGIAIFVVVVVAVSAGAVADRLFEFKPLDLLFPKSTSLNLQQRVVTENNDVIDVVKKVGPSVVTVSAQTPKQNVIQFSPFGGFTQGVQGGTQQDIGSGFVVSADGLIVTNKHVVADTTLSYKVSTSDGKTYDASQINRDLIVNRTFNN